MSSNFQSRLIPVEGEGSSESSFKSRLVPAEDQGFFEKRGRDLLEAGKKQIGYGVQAASAIAGTPRRFTELLNLIPTATQKYLGFGKPATEEELSKLPTSEEAYQFLTQKLGLPEGENKEALEFYENAADLIATGTPPQIAIAMAVGGSLSKQAASAAGFGETGQKVAQITGELGPAVFSKGKVRPKTLPKGVELTSEETMALTKGAERAEKGGIYNLAKPTQKGKEIVKLLDKKLQESASGILGDAIVDFSVEGVKGAEKAASRAYNLVREAAKQYPQTIDPKRLNRVLGDVSSQIKKTGGILESEKAVLQFVEDALASTKSGSNADKLMETYFKLSELAGDAAGTRMSPLLRKARSAVVQELHAINPALGKGFLKATEQYSRLQSLKQIYPVLEETIFSEKGTDFQKLRSALKDPKQRKLFEAALGEKGVQGLSRLSEYGLKKEEIERLFKPGEIKAWVDALGTAGEYAGAVWKMAQGDILGILEFLGPEIGRRFLTRMLIDPKYSNLLKSFTTAIRQNNRAVALQIAKKISEGMEVEFEET